MKYPLCSLSLAALMTTAAHGISVPSIASRAEPETRPAAAPRPLVLVSSASITIDPEALTINGRFNADQRTLTYRFQLFSKIDVQEYSCDVVVKLKDELQDPAKGQETAKTLEEGSRAELQEFLKENSISVRIDGPLDHSKTRSRVEDAVAVTFTQLKIDALLEGAQRCQP